MEDQSADLVVDGVDLALSDEEVLDDLSLDGAFLLEGLSLDEDLSLVEVEVDDSDGVLLDEASASLEDDVDEARLPWSFL